VEIAQAIFDLKAPLADGLAMFLSNGDASTIASKDHLDFLAADGAHNPSPTAQSMVNLMQASLFRSGARSASSLVSKHELIRLR
jgi:hypothetical protein